MMLLFQALCLGVAYGAFCRAVHLNRDALLRIRAAVTAVCAVSMYALYLTLATTWAPDILHVLLMGAFWAYMLAFSKTWPASGMPPQLHRSHSAPRSRPPVRESAL